MGTPPRSEATLRAVLDALKGANGNKTKAAASIGMNRSTFHDCLRDAERRGMAVPRDGVSEFTEGQGLPGNSWSVAWLKVDDKSVLVHNPDRDQTPVMDAIRETIDAVKAHAPKYPPLKYTKPDGPHCLIVSVTDLHFGAYGLDEASSRLEHAVNDAISKASVFEIERIVFVGGSDLLHTDTAHYTTTKGTPQEMDGSTWAQAFKAAQAGYVRQLEKLVQIAPVDYLHCSGNHDELMGWALSQVLAARFDSHKHMTFDVSDAVRKYVKYGGNLFGFTHGDKARETDIPMIMAQEAPAMWGQTVHRYMFMGHVHHSRQIKYQSVKEHPGVILEWLRSPKPTDKWHGDRGLLGAQGFKSFVHCKENGQVATYPGIFP